MEKVLFIIFAVVAVAAALNILLQRNPLHSALSLVGTLIALSALYVMLRAQFIAAIQVVVYAGAIMVLFVFVIMLLNAPKEAPYIEKHKALRYLAIPFAGLLIAEAFYIIRLIKPIPMPPPDDSAQAVYGRPAPVRGDIGFDTDGHSRRDGSGAQRRRLIFVSGQLSVVSGHLQRTTGH
jgi:NADH:ubiquinone oxidoreductase subunit 6 (subunit J)